MRKNKIATECIQVGLNLCSTVLNIDGSAVIPSLVGKVLNDIGECKTCKYGTPVDGSYDGILGEYLDNIECSFEREFTYKPLDHYCAWYEPELFKSS